MEVRRVARRDDGGTLQDFLAAWLGISRRAAKAIVDGRRVWVNRRCVWMAHHRLKTGDVVEVPRVPAPSPARAPERQHVRVLVETQDFLVVDKPSGMLSCGESGSVEAVLREQLQSSGIQPVHRLDRGTSGCLMFAKTSVARDAAVEVFKTHRVSKTYFAVVAGRYPYAKQTIDAPIDGERAVTHVSREMSSEDATLLRVRIETGRTHQIRRHLASVRFPVIGDRTFGPKNVRDPRMMAVPRLMLHAAALALPDPTVKGGEIKARSPMPADFRAALRMFGLGRRGK